MPINLGTINQFYGKSFGPEDARRFLEEEIAREGITEPRNFEEKAITLIGRPLYEAFIKGYSEKQWETDLKTLPASIITRLPMRFNYNDRYFDDTYEGIPVDGYHRIFTRMLAHPNIHLITDADFFAMKDRIPSSCTVIYTGPVDRYFEFKHGRLGWRTLRFESEVVSVPDYQGTSVMNYADREVPYTRVHEFRHFHPERRYASKESVIFREYSKFAEAGEEPYYPVNTEENRKRFERYRGEMAQLPNVIFGGRLATYKYLDMHQVIGAALVTYQREIKAKQEGATPRFNGHAAAAA